MLSVAIRQRLGTFVLDVAFEGPEDGVTVLFGPSGAGKSATLAAIGGATRPDAAYVAVGDRVLIDTANRIAVPPRQRRIGWVYQDARLFPHMPVRANLIYGERRAQGRARIAFADVVDVLAIAHLLDRRIADLSGGERQRVALGRALLSQPDLLLLDEPLAALDDARKREILAFIQRLKADFRLPMIYVTHSMAEARALADHIVRIDQGTIVTTAPSAPPETIVHGTVTGHDDALMTTTISVEGRAFVIPKVAAACGARVTIATGGSDSG